MEEIREPANESGMPRIRALTFSATRKFHRYLLVFGLKSPEVTVESRCTESTNFVLRYTQLHARFDTEIGFFWRNFSAAVIFRRVIVAHE